MLSKLYLSSFLVAGAFIASVATAAPAGFDVEIKDPYIRAMPAGQPNTAAYMTLENTGGKAHALVSAESVASEAVELHTHIQEDGMMKMRKVPKIEIPAGGAAELKPGGLHIMLIGLKEELKPGESVSLNLIFDDGSRTSVLAPVRAPEE